VAITEKFFIQGNKVMLYKRGDEGQGYAPDSWYVKIKFPKKPAVRQSLGTPHKDEAIELANDLFQEQKYRNKKGLSIKQTSFRSIAKQYLSDLKSRTIIWQQLPPRDRGNLQWASSNKLKNQTPIIQQHLIPHFNRLNIQDISKKDVKAYIRMRQTYWIDGKGAAMDKITYQRNGRKVSRPKRPSEKSAPSYGTVNKELTVLRQIFAFAHDRNLLSSTEIPAIRNLPKPKNYDESHDRPSFTEDELETVLKTIARKWEGQKNSKHKLAHMRLIYYILLLSMTGMRVTEAKSLRFSAFQTYNHHGVQELKVTVGGKNKKRVITPTEGCSEMIERWKRHHKANAKKYGWDYSDDIYVLTNEHGYRIKSHDRALSAALEECDLLYTMHGTKRNAGSFRSHYITTAPINSELTPIQIAVNCGTSVEVIERHYNKMQSTHIPDKFKFPSFINDYF